MDKDFQKEYYEDKIENFIKTPKDLLLEKLVMHEQLNANDFNELLKTIQEEFNRSFCISNNDLKGEKELE